MPDVVRLEYENFSDFYDSVVDVSKEDSLYRVIPDLEALSKSELKMLLTLLIPSKISSEISFAKMKRLFKAVDACFYTNLISK